MGPSVSLRKKTVLVQKKWDFGSMTRVCVSGKKEAVLVLLGTLYGSQCESKRHCSVISYLETKFCRSCQQALLHSLFALRNLNVSPSLGERNFSTPTQADFV
jgi:hypothetical protein